MPVQAPVPRSPNRQAAWSISGPRLGEHNAEVYGELLGLTASEIDELHAARRAVTVKDYPRMTALLRRSELALPASQRPYVRQGAVGAPDLVFLDLVAAVPHLLFKEESREKGSPR